MSVDMLRLQVKLHQTQVAAEAAVRQESVKVLREMQTYKIQKILHHYICFCSATMLTSKKYQKVLKTILNVVGV